MLLDRLTPYLGEPEKGILQKENILQNIRMWKYRRF